MDEVKVGFEYTSQFFKGFSSPLIRTSDKSPVNKSNFKCPVLKSTAFPKASLIKASPIRAQFTKGPFTKVGAANKRKVVRAQNKQRPKTVWK